MMKIMFVGSNPSVRSGSAVAFWNDTKSRAVLDGWTDQLLKCNDYTFYYTNVYNKPTVSNRPLTMKQIKESLDQLKNSAEVQEPDRIIALGKTAEKALTLLHIPHMAMPHPSGLNRKLNDKTYVEQKIKELVEYCSPTLLSELNRTD
jgi:uracil-DNA glycosylase